MINRSLLTFMYAEQTHPELSVRPATKANVAGVAGKETASSSCLLDAGVSKLHGTKNTQHSYGKREDNIKQIVRAPDELRVGECTPWITETLLADVAERTDQLLGARRRVRGGWQLSGAEADSE